ncbi:MAG TPA: hypothetical protein VL132_15170 [Planctomycetaceae bacterium]|nr:hypothetical protein [Planctomycetaceae bacterium]
MSDLTLNLHDSTRSFHARLPDNAVGRIVASLGADPETVEELEHALGRFERRTADRPLLSNLSPGFDAQAADGGIVYLDLPARLIVFQSPDFEFLTQGGELWYDGQQETDVSLPFCLHPDWVLSNDLQQFDALSWQRREARGGRAARDDRAVLYGRLPEFIATELQQRRRELAALNAAQREAFVRQRHIDWLMTARNDLGGRSPRDVLIDDRHEHIEIDIQNQQHHWSFLRQPPPAVLRDSHAYRFGGFGTHEIVLYYDLVRELLWEAVDRACQGVAVARSGVSTEIDELHRSSQDWLHRPLEEFHGRTPASMIDKERRRLPEKACGDEAVVDPECPCCQMLADEETWGPVFWHLDGCNMDDDFAFSFERSYEEWKRRWDYWNSGDSVAAWPEPI